MPFVAVEILAGVSAAGGIVLPQLVYRRLTTRYDYLFVDSDQVHDMTNEGRIFMKTARQSDMQKLGPMFSKPCTATCECEKRATWALKTHTTPKEQIATGNIVFWICDDHFGNLRKFPGHW
jgi:hypothetical protein